MPAAAARDLDGLHAALARHPVAERDRLTLEVVLVGGVNDSIVEAKALAAWATGLPAKVNLIRFNPFPESGLAAPREDAVLAYQKLLRAKGIPAFIRQSRGSDILAACGQLLAE
jgi:23S rRNA (adenine2503-C2)-methyltransferase